MYNISENGFLAIFKNSLKITHRTLSIKTLLSDRNLKRINYKPYYQRNYVWNNVKQSFFIESVILGTEIPPLILFKSGTQIEVIDGRQRFETLKKFIEGEIILTEKGLMSLPALNKLSFNKLKDELKSIFWESNIRVYEFEVVIDINSSLEDKIKKEIFRRYNTGITPLTSVEVDAAKYDKDELSGLFENEIKTNKSFYTGVKTCFFPKEDDGPDLIEKMIDFMRRAFILSQFPISRYARGSQRAEILGILYDTTVNNIENIERDKDLFINQIKLVISIQNNLVSHNFPTNKLICEAILWALRILEQEDAKVNIENYRNELLKHYTANIHKYSDENSFFYKNIIERFSDTADLFERLFGINFDIYLRKSEFSEKIRELRQSDKDAEDIIKTLESLRINKPSPVSKPVEEILSDVVANRYLIRPSYQRQEKISIDKASSIIESILLGIYLPPIFVYKRKDGIKEVIDGQQRLLSIIGFMGKQYRNEDDKLTYSINNNYKLKKLNILQNMNGCNYNSLSEEYKDKIIDFVIDEIIIEESLNVDFDPTDLFIRLNQKPYPIKNNSFEMWNSTIDREIIETIKRISKRYAKWFFLKENTESSDTVDRMENEELITILSFLTHHLDKDHTYEKVLGLFKRSDRITCRIKNKNSITNFLSKLDDSVIEKRKFMDSITKTEELINALGELFGRIDSLSKETLNEFFNIKKTETFKRSYQDFYITWLLLNSEKNIKTENDSIQLKKDIQNMLGVLRNTKDVKVDDLYFNNFISELNARVLKYLDEK